MTTPAPMNPITPNKSQPFSNTHEIKALRTQIKANATLLFWKSRPFSSETLISEVAVMATRDGDKTITSDSQAQPGCHVAVLSIPKGFGPHWSEAARGEPRDTVVSALQSLLAVTGAGLTEYEEDLLKPSISPALIAGGTVSEWLVKGYPDPGMLVFAAAAVGCAVGVFCLLPPKQKLLSMLG